MDKAKNGKKYLESVRDELQKCAKCGSCRSVCPVFAEHQFEKYVARGKIALCQALAEETIPLTDTLEDILQNCLLCMSCVKNCSREVRTDKIIAAAREAFFRSTSHLKEKYDNALRDEYMAQPSLRERIPQILKVADPIDSVLFFTGCFTNHVYPTMGEATIGVLNKLNVTIEIPNAQECCGSPAFDVGDTDTVEHLAKTNIDAMKGTRHVIVVCASGGNMLKHGYPDLFKDNPIWRQRAESLASRTYDISEYLVEKIGLETIRPFVRNPSPHRVTYHDPCRLNRGQGIQSAPRELLKLACKDKFIESPEADRCCGAGTIYGIAHPETSEKIRSRKIDRITASGAKEVATGCPICMLQISGVEGQERSYPFRAMHTILVLARSMGLLPDASP
jgi:glycolate oxidase iron-sulfur subunit